MLRTILQSAGVIIDSDDPAVIAQGFATLAITAEAGTRANEDGLTEAFPLGGWDRIRRLRAPQASVVPAGTSATALAAAWRSGPIRWGRLAVDPDLSVQAPDALSALATFAVEGYGGTAFLADEAAAEQARLSWPLRLGVLPDPDGLDLAASLVEQELVQRGLGRVLVLGIDGDDCDVLFLPETLE
jgi:hypothetical protein